MWLDLWRLVHMYKVLLKCGKVPWSSPCPGVGTDLQLELILPSRNSKTGRLLRTFG